MDQKIIEILNQISDANKLWIKDAYKDIKEENTMYEKITEICTKSIKEYEEEQIGLFGEIVCDIKKTEAKDFLLAIQKLNKNELMILKDIFEKSYNDSKRQSYNVISECITLILELRMQVVSSTVSQIKTLPHEKHEYYYDLLPKYILEQIADINEVKLEEVKEKVLKKI